MTAPDPLDDRAADDRAADELAARANPPAVTAGQEDHSDPWRYAGEDADAPTDTGREG